jgi:aconitase B
MFLKLAAVIAKTGKIPSVNKYFKEYTNNLASQEKEIYSYLQFDKIYN